MSIVHFVKTVGKDLSGKGRSFTASALKKDLDSYNIGTEKIRVQLSGELAILRGAISTRTAFEKMIVAAGNVLGIGAVDADGVKILEEGADTGITLKGQLVYYVVKYGDNLSKIAEKLYGRGASGKGGLIFEANRPMLKMPAQIYTGQILRVPVMRLNS